MKCSIDPTGLLCEHVLHHNCITLFETNFKESNSNQPNLKFNFVGKEIPLGVSQKYKKKLKQKIYSK